MLSDHNACFGNTKSCQKSSESFVSEVTFVSFLIVGLHAFGRQKDNRHSTRGLSADSNSENLQISSSAQGKPEKVLLQMVVLFLERFCIFLALTFVATIAFLIYTSESRIFSEENGFLWVQEKSCLMLAGC